MTQQINIRQETAKDYEAVFALNHLAFGQEGEAKLVDALRQSPTAFVPELSLVALAGQQIVGHILFTKIHIQSPEGQMHESLALAPMAVAPEVQKNGVGGQLIREGLRVATALGFESVIVLGHDSYYPKFGFQAADKWAIKAPFEVPTTAFMAIELKPNALQGKAGIVRYPKEFDAV